MLDNEKKKEWKQKWGRTLETVRIQYIEGVWII